MKREENEFVREKERNLFDLGQREILILESFGFWFGKVGPVQLVFFFFFSFFSFWLDYVFLLLHNW